MQSASTETFSISFPSLYETIRITEASMIAEHQTDDNYISFISVGLQQLSFYDKFTGNDLLTRFRESCFKQRGTVELVADKTLTIAGITSHIRTVQSPDGYFYYFGLLPISTEYGYVIIADCDTPVCEFYKPLFDEIWQSLAYFGNPAEAIEKQQAAIDKILSQHKPITTTQLPNPPKAITPFSIPANGQEYWQIGEHMFSLSGNPQLYISDGDGALYIKIEAQAPYNIIPEQSDLISQYNDRKVYLQFYFKGIYNAGIPTGQFHFEKEREESHMAYLWKGGFQYAQSLTIAATLTNGWLGIQGQSNNYPVQLAVKLDLTQLEWDKYHFRSTEEANTAAPDAVRHLWLTNPNTEILQDTLQPLSQLQALSIDYSYNNQQAAGFTAIPEAVQHLQQLTKLSLTGVSALEHLPTWLSNLEKLQTITIQGSKVTTLPTTLFQLPALQKLYLSNNQLQSIPAILPTNLETLVLAHNQLITIPAAFLQLQYLNIEHNPLQQLPAGLENIPQLSLELEKKITLLDYSYQGADSQGVAAYDNSRFYAKNDTTLLPLLQNKIEEAGLTQFTEGLLNRARTSVALATTEEDTYIQKGNHRFGGLPDLPLAMPYPTFTTFNGEVKGLQFIAQINCTTIAHLQNYLPRTGILYFFIEDLEALNPKVIYYNGHDLQSAKDLNIDPNFIYEDNGIYTPFQAQAAKYASIPHLYHAHALYPELAAMEDLYDETEQLQTSLQSPATSPVHSINSYVFKQHETPEIEAVDKKKGHPEEWMVLLSVSSDQNPGFHFWDAGVVYFVIHKSDLEKKNFSNVYAGLESS